MSLYLTNNKTNLIIQFRVFYFVGGGINRGLGGFGVNSMFSWGESLTKFGNPGSRM